MSRCGFMIGMLRGAGMVIRPPDPDGFEAFPGGLALFFLAWNFSSSSCTWVSVIIRFFCHCNKIESIYFMVRLSFRSARRIASITS